MDCKRMAEGVGSWPRSMLDNFVRDTGAVSCTASYHPAESSITTEASCPFLQDRVLRVFLHRVTTGVNAVESTRGLVRPYSS